MPAAKTQSNQSASIALWPFGLTAFAVFMADQITKLWVTIIFWLGQSVPVLPGVLHLTRTQNTGVAFSMLSQWPWLVNLLATALLATAYVALWRWRRQWQSSTLAKVAAGMIIGGAAGNVLDRWVRGAVVDFIDVTIINYPVFNLADTAICVGAGLWAWWVLTKPTATAQTTPAVPLHHG